MKKRILGLGTIVCVLLLLTAGAAAASDPMDVVRTILNDPQVLLWEDATMMDYNGGMYFGDVAQKRLSADGTYYEFASDANGAYMIGNLNFLDIGEFRGNAQAILFKFRSGNPGDLSFILYGAGEIVLSFADGQPVFAHRQDNYEAPYAQYRETNLTVEPDRDYWVLMAMDSHAYYRSLVWADDDPEDVAYCGENIGDWHSEYRGSNWHLTLAFGPDETLQFQEYSVMDFDSIVGMEGMDGDQGDQGDQGGEADYADPMETVNEIVIEPDILYTDDLSTLPEHGYAYYSEVADKHPGDGFEFYTDGDSDGFTFFSTLNDIVPEGSRKDNLSQGVLLCFKSNNPTALRLSLSAVNTVYVTFQNGGTPEFGILEKPEIGQQAFESPSGFTLEADTWYYALIAVDIQSNLRMKVWEYGRADNSASYGAKLVQWCGDDAEREEYWQQKWTFGVDMGHYAQFNLMDFRVFDFDEIRN